MSTQLRAQIDKYLTNVSNQYIPEGYISEAILPLIAVKQFTGRLAGYGNDHLRIVPTITGGKNNYPMIQTQQYTSQLYELETHALKDVVTLEDKSNIEEPYDAIIDMTNALVTHLWLGKEKSLADTITDPAIITQNTTIAAADRYDNYTSTTSTPLSDFNTAKGVIRDACGGIANVAIMDWKVAQALRNNPQIKDILGYKFNQIGSLSDVELARALNVERVLVANVVYNNSVAGQADVLAPVWGKDIVFAVCPTTAQKRQVSLGYRLQLAGKGAREVRRAVQDEPWESEKIMVRDIYDLLISNASAAYLIQDAIS